MTRPGGSPSARPRRMAIAFAVLALPFAAPAPARGEDESRVDERLRIVRSGTLDAAWDEAVAALQAGAEAEQAAVAAALEQVAAGRHRACRRAAARLTALWKRVGDGRRQEKVLSAWDDARNHAIAWIFDEERFPVPAEAVITGPMEGYPEAKTRGDAAVAAWERLAARIDDVLAPIHRVSLERARALLATCADEEAGLEHVLERMPAPAAATWPAPALDPLVGIVLGLREGRFRAAAEAYAHLGPGWRRAVLFHAYGRAVREHNRAHPCGMSDAGVESIDQINRYRLALGISPLVHDEKLVRAAEGHSTEMTRLGFFSHRSPTPGRETKEQRAKTEGYTGRIVECITAVGSGAAAVEFWKYDGGHHRDMVGPQYVDAGFGTRGPAVLDAGTGEDDSLPALRY